MNAFTARAGFAASRRVQPPRQLAFIGAVDEFLQKEDNPLNNQALSAKARILIRKPPAAVFAAFADAGAMSQFWFARRDAGLKAGETVAWFIGSDEHAVSFDVRVEALIHPSKLVIAWERDGAFTQITWTLAATAHGDTILTIEESGFAGDADAIAAQILDSTGGFNQVIVAAKAWIEHGVALNVVTDHA